MKKFTSERSFKFAKSTDSRKGEENFVATEQSIVEGCLQFHDVVCFDCCSERLDLDEFFMRTFGHFPILLQSILSHKTVTQRLLEQLHINFSFRLAIFHMKCDAQWSRIQWHIGSRYLDTLRLMRPSFGKSFVEALFLYEKGLGDGIKGLFLGDELTNRRRREHE